MKIAKNRTMATMIALFLVLTIAVTLVALPAVNALDISTYAFIYVAPNPVGVGQNVEIFIWLNMPPPTASGPYGDRWQNFNVVVTKPDGTNETRGPFTSDATGSQHITYMPDTIGNYTFVFSFPGQTIAATGNYYTPSTSATMLTVQQQPITGVPETPLPTAYWTRPINAQNYLWYNTSGNWLGVGGWPGGKYDASGTFNPYTTGPNSAHIMWTKPLAFGGLVGGPYDSTEYYEGLQYEPKFANTVISNGMLYYNTPDNPRYGFYCVDLRTGETVWWQNSTGNPIMASLAGTVANFGGYVYPGISMGQLYNYESPNQMGVIPYLWGIYGSTWSMYDAYTGNWILNLVNASSGTITFGSDGSILVYMLNGAQNWLAMWNSSKAIPPPSKTVPPTSTGGWAGTGEWLWRPPMGATLDWNAGIQWNVTVPDVPGTQSISKISPDIIYARSTIQSAPTSIVCDAAYSLKEGKEGQQLWVQNRTAQPSRTSGPMGDGVYTEFVKETMQWYGYDIYTGNLLWGPTEPYTNALGMYSILGFNNIAYGNLYAGGFDGYVYCYNLTTGQLEWKFSTGSSGYNTPFGRYPCYYQVIADGKVYETTTEHHALAPLYKGYSLYCIDAETGQGLWNISGWYEYPVIADGELVTYNAYDQQVYAYGMGPSKTTVTAPSVGVTTSTPVTITGTVTDISAGTQQEAPAANFPNGLPCVSDASMTGWMEYVYMQQPMPTNATGVPVTISVVDSNGNYRQIGTTTSDTSGTFGFTWTPDIPGQYTVIATFAGSQSYYGSSSETYFTASAPAPTASPYPVVNLPPTETYFAISTVAIIIAIAIVGLLILRKKP